MRRNPLFSRLLRSVLTGACALLALVAAACSSSGGGSGGGGSGDVGRTVFVDTAAGSAASLVVRVLGVSAERVDGELSQNLLAAPISVTLADPRGSTVGFAIGEPPAGAPHVALRMLLDPAASRAVLADGSQVGVELPSAELRVTVPESFSAGDGLGLELIHATPPVFAAGSSGAQRVTLDLALRASTEVPVRGVLARVLTVDPAARSMLAELPDLGGVNVSIGFEAGSTLQGLDGSSLDVDTFLRECQPGSEVRVDGRRRSDDSFSCRSGEHERRGDSREPKFTGRVGSIDTAAMRFALDAFLRRPAGGREEPFFGTVTVDASNARIRREIGSSTYIQASFADIQVGQVVEAEGREGEGGVLFASEVDIEDEGGANGTGEIEGRVNGVDAAAGTIDVRPRGDDPLIVGGERVQQVTVRVDAATWLFRDDGQQESITLSQVRTTDRIWIRGTVAGDGSVDASWVRVRDDS